MTFVYPQFFWAFAFLAIPVIIHLFNFRRYKKIEFSDVRFLKQVNEQTKRSSNLKHLLILFSRLLLISCLVLAFAKPIKPLVEGKINPEGNLISIYIDNSFSMQAQADDGSVLDKAKEEAIKIAEQYKESDKFQLLSNDFEGKQQRLLNQQELIQAIQELEICPEFRSLGRVLERQSDAFKNEPGNKISYLLSDFQKSNLNDLNPQQADSTFIYTLIPFKGQNVANVYIDSVWFETPVRKKDQTEKLKIRVVNLSNEKIKNQGIELRVNGTLKPTAIDLEANSNGEAEIQFNNHKAGEQVCLVNLKRSKSNISFDDSLYFSYTVQDQIKVMEIYSDGAGGELPGIFNDDAYYNFQRFSEKTIDPSQIPQQNLVILNGVENLSSGLSNYLTKFMEAGGSVAVFPGITSNTLSYNSWLSGLGVDSYAELDTANANVNYLQKDHVFFKGVFKTNDPRMSLPKTNNHFPIIGGISSGRSELFRLNNGRPFTSQYRVGSGKLYLNAVGLDTKFGNYTRHALFVTSLLRMAELSFPEEKLFYIIGKDRGVELVNKNYPSDLRFHIKRGNNFDLIPLEDRYTPGKIKLLFNFSEGNKQLSLAGHYQLFFDQDFVRTLGMNNNRKESEITFFENSKAIADAIEKQGVSLKNFRILDAIETGKSQIKIDQEIAYWKYFLWGALLFLLMEILLIRFWKPKANIVSR